MRRTSPLISAPDLIRAFPGLEGVRLLDCRVGPDVDGAFATEHLAGAVQAHLERDLSGDTSEPARGGRHPLPAPTEWARTLQRWGITPDTPVVVYDDRHGVMGAARAWWMLRAAGHLDVTVLEGGLDAARRAGLPMSSGAAETAPADSSYPVATWGLPMADIDDTAAAARDPSRIVLDVRAAPRFRGEHEPIDPIAGHIPGAVSAPLTAHLIDGKLLDASALAHKYETLFAGVPPEDVIVHCGSGVTACHTLLALEVAGLQGAALFVGSWSQWCRSDRAIGTGT